MLWALAKWRARPPAAWLQEYYSALEGKCCKGDPWVPGGGRRDAGHTGRGLGKGVQRCSADCPSGGSAAVGGIGVWPQPTPCGCVGRSLVQPSLKGRWRQ